jgi:hypothetical protein
MESSKDCGRFITKKPELKKRKLFMSTVFKMVCGQNGLKMAKKEEKEILKTGREIAPGILGMKMAITDFLLRTVMEN